MSLINISRAYGNVKRLRQIVTVLIKHGFSHVADDLNLLSLVPGLTRIRTLVRPDEEVAHLSVPERLACVLQDLGPTSIKLGQLLATRPDLIPLHFAEAFSRLQSSVEPLPIAEVRALLEHSLERPASELFQRFDERAIASGSIGQVHTAKLHDGTEVVIKIKRPGTDKQVRDDLNLLARLAELAEQHLPDLAVLRPRMLVDEFSRAMERELDFVGEAACAEKFAKQFSDEPRVNIPKVHWDFVTHDVLVLERIEGARLSDRAALASAEIDRPALAALLGQVFLRQYFVTGFFHADPHPGNLVLQADGRLAILDFGQTGHLSSDLRRRLALALVALASGETDFIVDILAEVGMLSDQTDLRAFRGELAQLLDRYYGIPAERIEMGLAFREVMTLARSHGILLPREFVLMSKSFITVLSVISQLDPSWSPAAEVQHFRKELFGTLADPRALLSRFGFYAARVAALLRRAPEDLRDLLDKARAGQVRIRFQHEGVDPLVRVLEEISRSITVALIIAGVTIGSSIVLAAGDTSLGAIPMPFSGLQIPAGVIVASGGFMGAVLMGLWLTWTILRKHR